MFSEKIAMPELRDETCRTRVEDLDAETGVPSRVSAEAFLREQIEACTTQGSVCGVIAIRLDCFDDFRHGHGMEAGSAIIREVAHAERYGAAERYGGAVEFRWVPGNSARMWDRAARTGGGADEAGGQPGRNSMVGRPAVAQRLGEDHYHRERGHAGIDGRETADGRGSAGAGRKEHRSLSQQCL